MLQHQTVLVSFKPCYEPVLHSPPLAFNSPLIWSLSITLIISSPMNLLLQALCVVLYIGLSILRSLVGFHVASVHYFIICQTSKACQKKIAVSRTCRIKRDRPDGYVPIVQEFTVSSEMAIAIEILASNSCLCHQHHSSAFRIGFF